MSDIEQGKNNRLSPPPPKKKSRAGRVVGIITTLILLILLALLLTNSILTLFMPHYYPTFGNKRLFAVVTDSMEPEIPTGSMIVDTVPASADDIQIGSVITFEVIDSKGKVAEVLTHRVVAFGTQEDAGLYLTKGDNAEGQDDFHPSFENIIGVYTGNKCAFLGAFFGWLHSTSGMTWLFIIIAFIIIGWGVIAAVAHIDKRRQKENAALKRSAQELSNVNLRYDNIREITAVLDVLDMVTDNTENRNRRKEIDKRLDDFIAAETIELPQTPETAALLDTLPAPDTPMSLASALRSGATLRQAEDGETLVLTGLSGGRSILLTPVQTPDGIILCQQGVRLKSDLAPNIESIGATSMPEYPEFFEGQPIKKNVEYPELPQPKSALGVELLSRHTHPVGAQEQAAALNQAEPKLAIAGGGATDTDAVKNTEEKKPTSAAKPKKQKTPEQLEAERKRRAERKAAAERKREEDRKLREARIVFAKYRTEAAEFELKQTAELRSLISDVSPFTDEDKERLQQYRDEQKRAQKDKAKKPVKKKTPEQLATQRERALKRKAEREEFLQKLTPVQREIYLSDEKLRKTRAASIRRLKKIEKDRQLLETLD